MGQMTFVALRLHCFEFRAARIRVEADRPSHPPDIHAKIDKTFP
jgi:hypothetical protein